jgi:cell division septation protein DedD
MQFETAHLTCPLCKRLLPADTREHTLSTKLCEQCQTLVLKAFRGADSIVATSATAGSQSSALACVQSGAPAHTLDDAPAFFELNPTEPHSPIHFPIEPPDALRFDFYQDEVPDDRIQTVKTDSSAFSENGSSLHREELSERFEQSPSPVDHTYTEADEASTNGQPFAFTKTAVDSGHSEASLVEDRGEGSPAPGDEAVTDPWEAPLPAWDYSESEWPVLVGPGTRRSFGSVRLAIAAVVFLACVAGLYFLINRPSIPANGATDSGALVSVQPRAAAAGSADSDAHDRRAATAAVASSNPSSLPAETAGREASALSENSSEGRFSLQAAAFPTQGGADEFAEKLKRAGVPSYVIPADLVRRGRWFRVRVGRFNSAEEAQKFAGEAQQRARTAGLAVQLIACPYNQP